MDKADWKDAPDWADRLMRSEGDYFWCSVVHYSPVGRHRYTASFSVGGVTIGDFELIEMRPDEWKKGEERMDQIQQNGNDGLLYDELDDYSKQPRYKGDDGLDHIDEFARDNSIEDFRAAMRFTIGKYDKRLGKKDAMSKELYKMSDYYKRWSEVEKKLGQEKG